MKRLSFLFQHGFLCVVAYVVSLYITPTTASAQWALMRTDADSAVRAGVRHIYNLEFDSAATEFQKVMRAYPQHPAGYFLDAMVDWWAIVTNSRDKRTDERFLRKIDRIIALCDSILSINEHDIVGLFFKGGIIGFRGRYYVLRNDWAAAALDGKRAFDLVQKCQQIAPGNRDVMLGTGIYHYFVEAIPERYPIVKPLIAMLPPGDKRIGIAELKLAAQSARYAATEAKVVLLQLQYGMEKNYTEALAIAQQLCADYPKNSMFKAYLGRCYVQLGDYEKMEEIWREILNNCIDHKTGYDNLLAREAMYYIGLALMQRGKYDEALTYFYKCDEFCRKLDEKPSGWMIMLNSRIGNIYDIQGKRELAIKQYQKVLSWEDYYDSHKYARQFLERPYGK
ncbi:MAG: tetratricopeptide repeat protein [Bacteroidota bacterium]|nr:tetratricopeptide repeat protein [Candidatus Kapabacteria bacterium]MDW8219368.1 tetratricopeptide repeat protein [Bacteroidota bacterium]